MIHIMMVICHYYISTIDIISYELFKIFTFHKNYCLPFGYTISLNQICNPGGLEPHHFLQLIYWQVMNCMAIYSPMDSPIRDALRRKPTHYTHCRNSNNCIRSSSLVVLAAILRLGTPGWVKWKSEFMLLSREA